MRLYIIEPNPKHGGFDLTAYTALDRLPFRGEAMCKSLTADLIAQCIARIDPGAPILIGEVTLADIDRATGVHREPEYQAAEAEQRAHDARTMDV